MTTVAMKVSMTRTGTQQWERLSIQLEDPFTTPSATGVLAMLLNGGLKLVIAGEQLETSTPLGTALSQISDRTKFILKLQREELGMIPTCSR